MAAVLCGHVDAHFADGRHGASQNMRLAALRRQVGFLAPVKVYPGERRCRRWGRRPAAHCLGLSL